jgi:hypothetical protein
MLTLDERKALVWFRSRQPTRWPVHLDGATPPRKVFDQLVIRQLIHLDPNRKRFSPPSYVLTEAGRRELEP